MRDGARPRGDGPRHKHPGTTHKDRLKHRRETIRQGSQPRGTRAGKAHRRPRWQEPELPFDYDEQEEM